MNLPVLDRLPALLPSRKEAFRVIEDFERTLYKIVRGKIGGQAHQRDDVVSHLLQTAFEEGKINDRQFRSNLKITFMVGHENTQFLLTSAMLELGRNTACSLSKWNTGYQLY
jgi:unspecific monooxygenase